MSPAPASTNIIVTPGNTPWQGVLEFAGQHYRCALGKAGIARQKCEGDHKTPVGRFALRQLLYRPDRFTRKPETALSARPLAPDDGWCDDPANPCYNRAVSLPCSASAERLWRTDEVYDLIIPLGYNDDPVTAGLGSAIFMHIARPDFSGTEGCVALARSDLIQLLRTVGPTTMIEIRPADQSAAGR